MSTVYRIAKFDDVFTKRDGRKDSGELRWVSMPIGFGSGGYQAMIEDFGDDAPAIYGAWCALVKIAAACPTPGLLCSSRGRAITPQRAAALAYMPAEPFRKLFKWASAQDIGWLEVATMSEDHPDNCPDDLPDDFRDQPGLHYKTEHNTTEQEASASCPEPASPASVLAPVDEVVIEFPVNGDKSRPLWGLTRSKANEYAESFPGVDVKAELLKARQWCRDNAAKRKTARGMPKFLGAWLSKAQNESARNQRGSPDRASQPTFREIEAAKFRARHATPPPSDHDDGNLRLRYDPGESDLRGVRPAGR